MVVPSGRKAASMSTKADCLGLILAGGFSTRMGKDKGLLPFATSSNFLTQTTSILQNLGLKTFISIREDQRSIYSHHLPFDLLLPDLDLSIFGPLLGILSSFQQLEKTESVQSLLVLPVDMPYLQTQTIHRLIESCDRNRSGVFYQTSQGIEPLCGIYSANLLKKWLSELVSGNWLENSPKKRLEGENLVLLELPETESDSFRNVNYETEIL